MEVIAVDVETSVGRAELMAKHMGGLMNSSVCVDEQPKSGESTSSQTSTLQFPKPALERKNAFEFKVSSHLEKFMAGSAQPVETVPEASWPITCSSFPA